VIIESQNSLEDYFMENYGGMSFRKFEESDVNLFTQMFKESFNMDSQIHIGENCGPDGYDNGEFLKKWFLHNSASAFAVYKDEKPIGGINVFINTETHENYLGNIFLDPSLQSKGVGIIIWKYIEQKYPETKIWKTDTVGFSIRNHYFYVEKCGFKIYSIKDPKIKRGSTYLMEKIVKN
jgi:predicted acetyltransferase